MAFLLLDMKSLSPLLLRRVWQGVGWFGIVLLLYLSLTPQPPEIPVDQGDKIGHSLAYTMLMFWWAQLRVTTGERRRLAASLIALGIAIEYVQGWTGWRSFDYFDMLADVAGVAIGWLLAVPRTPNVLALVSRLHIFSRS
jgi:VanZ family protein